MIAISDIKVEYGNAMALVILCSRVYFKTTEIDDLHPFITNNDIDWVDFIKTCRKHRIRPLVYKIILKTTLPEEVQKRISNELKKLTLKSFDQARETERLILLLHQNNINALPYKGTAFSKQFFGNISMRESSDIDLVIDHNDIPKAIHTLENDGFYSNQKNYYYSLGHKRFITSHKDFNFDKFIGNIRQYHVELHFNIINNNIYVSEYQNDFKTSSLENNSLFKEQVSFLNPIEHFRAISLHHMLQDGIGYLKTITDLTQALNKVDVIKNTTSLNSFEKATLNELYLNYNIQLLKSLINDLIGLEFEIETTKKQSNKLLAFNILSTSYKKNRSNDSPILGAIKHHFLYNKNTRQFYTKSKQKNLFIANRILSILTPQHDDFIAYRLTKNLYFLYYIIRPIRLIFFPSDPNKK